MACINMYNPPREHQSGMMGPRISFSCDFVTDSDSPGQSAAKRPEPDPSAPEFEFSPVVDSQRRPMIAAADELFYKGRLLPLKEQCAQMQRMTLRDELQAVDEEEQEAAARQTTKAPVRWKGLLGRRRAGGTVHKKQDKGGGGGGGDQAEGGSSGKSSLHPNQ